MDYYQPNVIMKQWKSQLSLTLSHPLKLIGKFKLCWIKTCFWRTNRPLQTHSIFSLTFKWVTFLDKFWLLNWAICLNKPYNISTWGSLFLKSVEFNKCSWNFLFLDEKDSIKEISKSAGLRLGFPFHWLIPSFLSFIDGR